MLNMLLEFESGAGNRFRFANMVLANIVLTSRRSLDTFRMSLSAFHSIDLSLFLTNPRLKKLSENRRK